jgi:hypothetical protein
MEKLSPDNSRNYHNIGVFDKSTYKTPMIDILNGIIQAFGMMLSDTYSSIENAEDIITARLVEDFLENDLVQSSLSLMSYRFIPEPAAYNAQYLQIGYSDIRVIVTHRVGAFDTTKADYIIECKRLDGKSGLNTKYVKEGICRFVEEKYTWKTVHKVSAMLGYIVVQSDIPKCVDNINRIGKKSNIAGFIQPLGYFQIRQGFDFSYRSQHRTNSGKNADIFHVLFDLSSKIVPDQSENCII